jgi:hypothetical protein
MNGYLVGVAASAVVLAGFVAPAALEAQVPVTGQVVVMPGGKPLVGAEVLIKAINRVVRSDSAGVFLMDSVPKGRYLLEAQKPGFRSFTSYISVQSASDPEYRIELTPAPAMVASVVTTADAVVARMAGFEERRAKKASGGRFLVAKDFQGNVGRPLADILARVPGITISRGTAMPGAAYIGNNRGMDTMRPELLPKVNAGDVARGANVGMCYAAVIVNGVVMYDGQGQQNLFDINSLPTQDVIGMEYYAGQASIPVQWSTMSPTCGLIAIWTKN